MPRHSAGSARTISRDEASAWRTSTKVLSRTSGNSVDRCSSQSPMRGALALPAVAQEAAEGHAAGGPVLAVAVDEEHRHVERPLGVVDEAGALAQGERQKAAAIGIGLEPGARAVALLAGGLAVDQRRGGEQRRHQRRQAHARRAASPSRRLSTRSRGWPAPWWCASSSRAPACRASAGTRASPDSAPWASRARRRACRTGGSRRRGR